MIKAGSILILICFIALGCSREIEPLKYGNDQCEYCKMTLTDKKFGAEILNEKGKAVKFDAIECMIRYSSKSERDKDEFYVIDYSQPGKLCDSKSSAYLISNSISSPMGENVCAFEKRETAEKFMRESGGRIFSWDEIKNEIK